MLLMPRMMRDACSKLSVWDVTHARCFLRCWLSGQGAARPPESTGVCAVDLFLQATARAKSGSSVRVHQPGCAGWARVDIAIAALRISETTAPRNSQGRAAQRGVSSCEDRRQKSCAAAAPTQACLFHSPRRPCLFCAPGPLLSDGGRPPGRPLQPQHAPVLAQMSLVGGVTAGRSRQVSSG